MKLGLLGTIIGFIIMLAPIGHAGCGRQGRHEVIDGIDERRHGGGDVHHAGGLVGSILVRIQYYMLDAATQRVFSNAVTLTETRVTPALERWHQWMSCASIRAKSRSIRSA